MFVKSWVVRLTAVAAMAAVGAMAMTTAALAKDAKTSEADKRFHHAYYLENAEKDPAAAADLYDKVVADRTADATLRRRAEQRAATCREEVASADLTRLMPPDTFAYIELNRPGKHVKHLLGALGLLAKEGELPGGDGPRVAVSPQLIEAALGIRGVAIALNEIDPDSGEPCGVAVIHPGDMALIHGLIATVLPATGKPVDSVEGFPVYLVDGEAYVGLTHRLVIVSPKQDLVSATIRRLRGLDKDTLASNPTLAELAKKRDASLLSFFLHGPSIMPVLKSAIEREEGARELAMADAILDLDSLQTLSGHIGVRDATLFADLELRLASGHHNLAFNFLRTPAIDEDMLKVIPNGAAAFVVGALNELSSRYPSQKGNDDGASTVVTGLDFGREFFANIASVAVFALPADGAGKHGVPIPDAAAVIRVNDPSRSEALWTQILGIASLAAGAPSTEGTVADVNGTSVRTYDFQEEFSLSFATLDRSVVVASTKNAMRRALETLRGGESMLDDSVFKGTANRIGKESTKAVFVHPGRILSMVQPFMSDRQKQEVAPFAELLTDTVASLVVDHSGQRLRMSLEVTGLPKIDALLSHLIAAEMGGCDTGKGARRASAASP